MPLLYFLPGTESMVLPELTSLGLRCHNPDGQSALLIKFKLKEVLEIETKKYSISLQKSLG
jgi:hypothetical protein